ncbi:MAG: NUDIX domain-containing protein [Bacteroidota bacterium]
MATLTFYDSENKMDALSVDCVLFGFDDKQVAVLLIKRLIESELGVWALPGGYIKINEHLDNAPRRILLEMANINQVNLEQIGAYGHLDRFPPERTITIAYRALVNPANYELYSIKDEALEAKWFPLKEKPKLPYDHDLILSDALTQLRKKIRHEPIGLNLLPEKFSLRQVQNLYEGILDVKFDNRNFRKKLLSMGYFDRLEEKEQNVAHRKAFLYRFNYEAYQELIKKGINFDL